MRTLVHILVHGHRPKWSKWTVAFTGKFSYDIAELQRRTCDKCGSSHFRTVKSPGMFNWLRVRGEEGA